MNKLQKQHLLLKSRRDILLLKNNEKLTEKHLGKLYKGYNGFVLYVLRIKVNMLGHYFGEFLQTKKTGGRIHIKLKKKKIKKK